jgi:hypothetical protein
MGADDELDGLSEGLLGECLCWCILTSVGGRVALCATRQANHLWTEYIHKTQSTEQRTELISLPRPETLAARWVDGVLQDA